MALRILLIHPAEGDVLQANLPREIEAVRGANPPISLLQVAEIIPRPRLSKSFWPPSAPAPDFTWLLFVSRVPSLRIT